MNLLRKHGGTNVYAFECDGCEHACEVSIPADQREQIACPAGCGALYVQYQVEGTPDLLCVSYPPELSDGEDWPDDDDWEDDAEEVDLEQDWLQVGDS